MVMAAMTRLRRGCAALILIGTAACGRAQDTPSFHPVATVDQVMDSIVIPSSQAIFDAVVYENGELVASPKTDDEWFGVQMHGFAVAEAGNLLMMAPRAKDTGEWVTFSRAMTDAAAQVTKAAESKDVERMLSTGSNLYRACVGCHEKYLPGE
jgi:hypothetical protein